MQETPSSKTFQQNAPDGSELVPRLQENSRGFLFLLLLGLGSVGAVEGVRAREGTSLE